jgi:hypothetical protein
MGNINITAPKILTEDSSFQLVRTNPRLTGNVKITISDTDELWLESIKANQELSKDLYSKFPIDATKSHPSNIFRFFNNGQTPNEIIFDINEQVDSTKTSKDFKDQYDFSHYFSGAKYLASNKYFERMSYFAPIYLKKELPSYFIIVKIDDPANFPLDQVKELYDSSQTKTDYLIDLFSKASIIKTFDLREETRVGSYIRKYVNDNNFPSSPLTVGFGENDYTNWNGILINQGKLGYRGELLNSLYINSQPLKSFEENITNGYSRHGILFPDILNLEFIFNDDSSEKYDFNRYLGFYINAIELTKLDIDLDYAYLNRSSWENTPHFKKKFLETDDVVMSQTNYDGVLLPYKNSNIHLSEFTNSFLDSDSLYLNYIQDKDNNLYIPKVGNSINYPFNVDYSVTKNVNLTLIDFKFVTSADLVSVGTGYSTSSNATTVATSGSGSGLTVATIDNGLGGIASFTIINAGTNYSSGDTVIINGGFHDAILTITSTLNGTRVSATLASHEYITDDLVVISSSDPKYSGEFLVTKIDDNSFEYSVTDSPIVSTATGTCKKELASGKMRLSNTKIDLGLLFGQSRNIFLQDTGFASSVPGYSHTVIEIKKNLNNYDEIRLYHPHGTRVDSIGKYDMIQSTVLYPLIPSAGQYYAYNDYDNVLGYDEFYINGSGYLSQVASALASCINEIRTRTFTAYAYDERVFIKLNTPGEYDSSYKLSYTSPTNDYSVSEIYGNSGSSLINSQFNFKGGSKETSNRLIMDAGHLDKLNQNFDSILIKSSDSYSKIRKISQYIDEINEKNSSTKALRSPAVFSYNEKIAVVLDEPETPTISHTEFLMRPKFRPAFGLLSFFSIKDLDLDFYSSTYTNFPEIDLYKYYFIPADIKLLEPNINYIVYNGDIILNDGSATGILYSSGTQFIPLGPAPLSYSIVSGNPLVTFNPSSSNLTIPLNDGNGEVNDFTGFSLLKDPSKVISQNSIDVQEYSTRTKYLNGVTPSEYDFYKENESLDFALRSKMIPYITKWGIKNGTDSRSNPYRLNTELIFGRNNFSPDHVDSSQNPLNFTHEWFYIESSFNYMNDDITVAKNNYYFETPFDYTGQLLTDPDYFLNYFTYTPTNEQSKEVADTQFRYSSLIKNSAGQYEAFFKGFKITFKDVTDPTVNGPDGKPLAKTETNRFDGYKFSCILKPVKEEINNKKQAPITYKVIEHTQFKFIVVVIEVAIGYLDQIDPVWYDLSTGNDLLDTANFNDPLFIPTDPTKTYAFETINGEYRINFNTAGVSNMTHSLLYSLKNKKYNNLSNAFSNIRLASKLNIAAFPTGNTVRRLNNIDILQYPSILSDDFVNPTQDTVIFINDTITGSNLFLGSKTSTGPVGPGAVAPYKLINIFDRVFDNYIHYDNSLYTPCLIAPSYPVLTAGVIPYGSEAAIDNYYVFKVMNGGEKYFERLLEKLSFAKFKKYVNEQRSTTFHKVIEYYSYSDSSGIPVSNPNFYLEILDQSNIEKQNQIITNYTSSVPTQFSGQTEIGTEYEVAELPRKYELNRYRGEYEPIVQNQLIYQSNFKFTKNNISDISLSNIKINSNVASNMVIPNFNHIKVSDSKVLDLESDDSYLPIYPKIDEVAIGQGEYFLLRGNWDWGFHYKYSSKSQKVPVSGALRVEEDDSFLAKLINLPEFIELDQFNQTFISSNDDLDKIDISDKELIIKDTPDSLTGIINLNNVLARFLIEDGITAKFNQYLINSNEFIGNFNSIEDYVKQYIKLNILKLYDVDINEFYSKPSAALSSTNTRSSANPNGISFRFLTDRERFTQGYTILKSLQINKKDRLVLKFSFTKKPGSGLLVSPKIKIKFI